MLSSAERKAQLVETFESQHSCVSSGVATRRGKVRRREERKGGRAVSLRRVRNEGKSNTIINDKMTQYFKI